MHVGRAIEGAIGSEFKVDALYLSADTQLGLRIDKLCDTYDRQILMSGEFYKMLSPKGKSFCRKIDQVCMDESKGAMKVSKFETLLTTMIVYRKSIASICTQVTH